MELTDQQRQDQLNAEREQRMHVAPHICPWLRGKGDPMALSVFKWEQQFMRLPSLKKVVQQEINLFLQSPEGQDTEKQLDVIATITETLTRRFPEYCPRCFQHHRASGQTVNRGICLQCIVKEVYKPGMIDVLGYKDD